MLSHLEWMSNFWALHPPHCWNMIWEHLFLQRIFHRFWISLWSMADSREDPIQIQPPSWLQGYINSACSQMNQIYIYSNMVGPRKFTLMFCEGFDNHADLFLLWKVVRSFFKVFSWSHHPSPPLHLYDVRLDDYMYLFENLGRRSV